MGSWFVRLLSLTVIAGLVGYGSYFYREEYRPLQQEADKLRSRVDQLSSQCPKSEDVLQRRADELQRELDAARTKLAGTDATVRQVRAESSTCDSQRKELQGRLAESQKARREVQQQLSQARAASQAELADLQAQHTQGLQQMQATVREKDAFIQELQTRFANLVKDTAEKQKAKESLEREVEHLKTALDASRARAYMLEQAQLKKQQVLEAQQEQGVDDLQQKDGMIQDLAARVASLERERSTLTKTRNEEAQKHKEELDSLKKALALSKHQAEILQQELSASRTRLAGAGAPDAGVTATVGTVPVALPQAEQVLVQRDRRIQQLSGTVAALQREKSVLLESKQRLNQEVLRWQSACRQ
jgi:chromosome segregation ATPase